VGTGKTTLCRCLLEKVPEDTDVAFIINPRLSVVDLLANICDELGISYDSDKLNNRLLVDGINHYLLERHAAGRHTVLVIDEAQNLDTEVLEQLRLLTNLETDERKLLQIILLGQPELQDKLNTPELRQLSQRVTARYHLQALNRADIQAYITHRLSVAGCDLAIFSPSALRFLHRRSQGIPRLINLICDRAMLGAFASGLNRIERGMIRQAAREVLGEQPDTAPGTNTARIAWAMAAVLLLIVTAWSSGRWMAPQSSVANPVPVAAISALPETALVIKEPVIPAAPESRTSEPLASEPIAEAPEVMMPREQEPEVTQTITASPPINAPVVEAEMANEPAFVQLPPAPPETGFLHDYQGAFSDLFTAWGVTLPDNSEPCAFALSRGLACKRISGELGKLR
ncbi:MAG: AAA family ATPase, partial [Mariprofundaceae bacterium]|nr:AAA family ATPase [Mariprofundaceae bacterium]